MPTFDSSADRSSWGFHQLLEWHFYRGTAPAVPFGKTGPEWQRKTFAAAVGYEREGERAVSNWLSGANQPSAGYYAKIEEALFGTNPDYEGWKLELRAARTRVKSRETQRGDNAGPATSDAPSQHADDAKPASGAGTGSWQMVRRWQSITGKWKFNADGSAAFLKPAANQPPYGICVSEVAFEEGEIKATVTPRAEINGRIVLGYRAVNEEYFAIGTGGWEKAYTLSHYTQLGGWNLLYGVGHEDDIEIDVPYALHIRISGRQLSLSSNGYSVFEFELPFPVRRAPLGLFAWGDKGHNVDFTEVAVVALT